MTAGPLTAHYRFGQFELQPDERRLLAGSEPVHLGRHAFDLLIALVERSGHLVTKDQLLERVWPKLVVEENTLQAHVSALRKVLGREAIVTVSGQGYRFTREVTEVGAAATPPLPTTRHNLPQQLTSFIGREKQIAELKVLLDRTRLLALTGAGGCGKTRLAVQVATDLVHAYPDGIAFVEFAALTDPDLVPKAVANVLGIKEHPGKNLTETIAGELASKHLLLLMDNAEHVLGACAQLADTVLRRCPRLVILVTTRERLGIAGELTYRVPSLSVPDRKHDLMPQQVTASESARLFIERARLQRPHFALTAENAPALASICHRLDGIPLAIELAAPRLRSMSVEEVSRRLDQRFGLLTGGSRTALPRHRTLRSMIDWSYDLLSDSEKGTLQRASVFSGGWTLEAAEQVCLAEGIDTPEVLDLLTSLADKNLVWTEENDGATRYGLLETVRHYARDQLRESGEEAGVQSRHLTHFGALAEEALKNLKGADQKAWLDRFQTEHDNLRAALAWSIAGGDASAGLTMAGVLAFFWAVRGYFGEGRSWLTKILAATSNEASVSRARALTGAGVIAAQQGDDAGAKKLYEQSLALYKALGDRAGMGYALRSLANVAVAQGDFATARAQNEESLVIARESGDRHVIASLLGVNGEIAGEQGDFAAAHSLLEECLAITRELGDQWTISWTLARLGRVATAEGEYPTAQTLFKEALTMQQELTDHWGIASFLEGYAAVAFRLAAPAPAARIWGGAERLREEMGMPLPASDRHRYELQVAAARAADAAEFERGWQEGRAMNWEQVVQYALDSEDLKPRDR